MCLPWREAIRRLMSESPESGCVHFKSTCPVLIAVSFAVESAEEPPKTEVPPSTVISTPAGKICRRPRASAWHNCRFPAVLQVCIKPSSRTNGACGVPWEEGGHLNE
jgi:hypothetical protein